MKAILIALLWAVLLSACGNGGMVQSSTPTIPNSPDSPAPLPTTTPGECLLDPLIAPTQPAIVPGYAELDESTNLHMTGTVQQLDLASYRLKITGLVNHPLTLTLDDLRCMPKITERVTLSCPSYFDDVAIWSGTPLKPLLEMAGLQPEAKSVRLRSADDYEAFLLLEDAMREDNFLAYEWEGEVLPIFHGFPVRAIMPAFPGAKWTKWLVEIIVK